jgi:ribonuclease HII
MRSPKWQFKLSELPESSYPQQLIAGVDEVGRGALFGPVVAAAVILPRSAWAEVAKAGVRDSKKLSPSRRAQLAAEIEAVAIDCQFGLAQAIEIDRLNILQASLLAMQRAVTQLQVLPELCLVDGRQKIPNLPVEQANLVKGDERSLAIAAASIVAKVWRDRLIVELAEQYPCYDLATNKGYGTAKHLLALQQHGPSPLHRQSFSPCHPKSSIREAGIAIAGLQA